MNLPSYELSANREYTDFRFISEGRRSVLKGVSFTCIREGVYNLALFDIDPATDKMDDLARSDNGDMERILATVARCIYVFLELKGEAVVLAKGSTASRNRLYRMAINKYLMEIHTDFQVWAYISDQWTPVDDDPGADYEAFLIKRKKN